MSNSARPRRRILVGVGGGIAAYKVCSVIRHFTEAGHEVRVVPTEAALRFVGAATFEALSGHPVSTDVFDDVDQVAHVRLGQGADLVVVAPATADLMARAASGRADDLLTASLLTVRCPVLFVPAMHTEMWDHPATAANVATLRAHGATVMTPASGRLTGTDSGPGRLPDPQEISLIGELLLERPDALPYDLAGVRVVISAGGTREPLDPVRFLGNHSSGKQGFALARAAAQRGATVTVVAGSTADPGDPAGVEIVRVATAEQLAVEMTKRSAESDVVIMAAAVADFRPVAVADAKIKKGQDGPAPIELTTNPDILRGLVESRMAGQIPAETVIVGFAAETGDETGGVLDHGRAKLARKGCDLLVVNAVGDGKAFGTEDNTGWLLSANGAETALPLGSKTLMSSRILDEVRALVPDGRGA
ncbi:phosphopantothenoylcysteine decarboxylase/phosphopantothenate/cysteine ligase [Gordonia bronchialis DSM 43247]|uniref:Coenzyme A biosynthesis bifunctional protein CoaBC n=1 Tax=Gordonia bronchialis (strain ATCC 25592 / DSM 43247 / BCRC 13721 / JCM 3198 / KCTC 3076 / NBRC 16047 / NCTC 10667) TaxID=526226 RepID=D0LCR8_GORB4|nr:bifunctional phosphopantothenoylcysteine decarboxylase/phosphopantothenate--cysteine ligase CoaBC [Gordonia bronchialis]ACY21589.1 phosphopantothenoylcysteine decarboxylase/phosphopantothenate/cysteine ligase [Gordonia bronchialis DSM 43247]MCC3324377.1 bifunctional phosphopantothenoylcysteine decarboxylase/phosphopantothenate--cysteine ligase CoaBC [Gordonia bronchialis]QGS24774.1 bifunctional phosphopantothenoylcysteine decarboxylase/phosphopantothenate--cysteine ligase CoaBC [Gordonia bron